MEYNVWEIIKNLYLPSKDFTWEMKKFVKSIWWRYGFKISDKDANNLLIWTILILKDKTYTWTNEKYNTLRLIHYWFNNTKVLVRYIDDIIDIYKETIFDTNWNIRKAWWSLVDNLSFITGTWIKDIEDVQSTDPDLYSIKETISDLIIYLENLEEEYERVHSKRLKKWDKTSEWNFNYWYWTEDQLLKSIRKWLDFLNLWEKTMLHFWYKPKEYLIKWVVYVTTWRYEEVL